MGRERCPSRHRRRRKALDELTATGVDRQRARGQWRWDSRGGRRATERLAVAPADQPLRSPGRTSRCCRPPPVCPMITHLNWGGGRPASRSAAAATGGDNRHRIRTLLSGSKLRARDSGQRATGDGQRDPGNERRATANERRPAYGGPCEVERRGCVAMGGGLRATAVGRWEGTADAGSNTLSSFGRQNLVRGRLTVACLRWNAAQ